MNQDHTQNASESTLLIRARNGDHAAFLQLVEPLRGRVWGVCLNIAGNHHDAEDAFQDSMIAAWQNLDRFRGEAKFGTWIYRVAANTAVSVVRRRKPNTDSVDFSDPAQSAATAEQFRSPDFADRIATRDAVRAAIAGLPDDFRTALVLREFGDLTISDIASHEGVPEATVKTRLHRARRQLADTLHVSLTDA